MPVYTRYPHVQVAAYTQLTHLRYAGSSRTVANPVQYCTGGRRATGSPFHYMRGWSTEQTVCRRHRPGITAVFMLTTYDVPPPPPNTQLTKANHALDAADENMEERRREAANIFGVLADLAELAELAKQEERAMAAAEVQITGARRGREEAEGRAAAAQGQMQATSVDTSMAPYHSMTPAPAPVLPQSAFRSPADLAAPLQSSPPHPRCRHPALSFVAPVLGPP